jgi:hypothetical protein
MEDIQIYVDLSKAVEANETAVANGETIDKNTTRIEVLKTGTWKTAKGNFSLTASDLKQMSQNYLSDVRPHSSTHGLPIDEEHSKKAALGWLKEPSVEANDKGGHTLFMNAHWTNDGLAKVKDKTYQFFSPEVHFQHDDPEGTLPKLRNVLMGGGVTNRPLFKGLAGIPALTASDGTADKDNVIYVTANEKESNVDLETIRKKANKDVTAEERKVLDGAKDQLNEQERKDFYPEEAAAAQKAADDKAAADKAAADAAAAAAAKKPAGVTANEDGTVTLDASEYEALKAGSTAGLEASEQLKRSKAESEVKEMFFSETEGLKLPTDMQKGLTDLWIDASEEQKETLRNVAKNSKPMLDANDKRENGSNDSGNGTAQDLLDDKAAEIMANDEKIGAGEALKKARRQNPDIAREADSEIALEQPTLSSR